MQTQNKILDDLSKLASSALGVAADMRSEVESRFREQFERILNQMELVSREEFDAVKAMAAKAREEQEILAERVAALEAQLGGKAKAAKPAATRRKTAAKPAAKKAAKTAAAAKSPKAK